MLGQERQIEVVDPELPEEEEEEEEKEDEGEEEEKKSGEPTLETPAEEEVTIFKPMMKKFPGTTAAGLRMRVEPSFLVREGGREGEKGGR